MQVKLFMGTSRQILFFFLFFFQEITHSSKCFKREEKNEKSSSREIPDMTKDLGVTGTKYNNEIGI